jgi:transaldolase
LNTLKKLHELGQSLWLDHITRDLLNKDVLMHLIEEWSITGLTFKPALFRDAIKNSVVYDAAIRKKLKENKWGE